MIHSTMRRTLTTKTIFHKNTDCHITKRPYCRWKHEPYYALHHAPGRHARRIWLLRGGLVETPWGTVYVGKAV